MLKIETINALQVKLAGMLIQLKAGEIQVIEYGDPSMPPGSVMSHLRIYFLPTLGGDQFTVKTVSQHIEGSGFYSPDNQVILDHTMNAVIYYHRPTSIRKLIEERRPVQPKLDFIAYSEADLVESRKKANGLVAYNIGYGANPN